MEISPVSSHSLKLLEKYSFHKLLLCKLHFLTGAIFEWRKQVDYEKGLVIGWWSDEDILDNTFLKINTIKLFLLYFHWQTTQIKFKYLMLSHFLPSRRSTI